MLPEMVLDTWLSLFIHALLLHLKYYSLISFVSV